MAPRPCITAAVLASFHLLGAGAVPRHSKFKVEKTGEIVLASKPALRLNVVGGEMKAGDPLVLWPCSAQGHEMFTFEDGLIKLTSNPNLCLNAEGGANVGSRITTWPCAHRGVAEAHEGFTLGQDGRIRLTEHPEKCINIKQGRLEQGAEVLLWKCEDEAQHHHDRFVYDEGMIKAMYKRDLHLNVMGGDLKNPAPVVLWGCDAASHEVFEFVFPENRIRLASKPEMCLNAEGGLDKGSRIVLWPCHATPQPHEKFVYDEQEQIIHARMVRTLVFNVKGGLTERGGEIILWLRDEQEL